MTDGAPATDEVRADSWGNLLTGLGGAVDSRGANYLRASGKLSQNEVDTLYRSNALAARVVDAIPDHGTRRWIDLETEEGEAGKSILDRMEELEVRERLRDWWALDRKDGGAVLVIGADDGQTPDQPLNLAAVRVVKSLHVLERWEVTRGFELEKDDTRRWFGTPTSYTLNSDTMGQAVGQQIHASRVLVLHGVRVSKRLQAHDGWGDSVLDRVCEPLVNYDTTWSYLGASIQRFSETWLKMKGLRELMAGGKGDVVKTRLTILSAMRSVMKIVPIDADDSVQEMALQLAGMEGLISKAEARLCAAAEMPGTVLFGYAPGGLSTDDASGTRNWGDTVAQRQRRTLLSPLNYLIEILLAAKEKPLLQTPRWQVVFRPLIEPTEKEVAEVEQLRAQTSAVYIQTQQLDPAEGRETLRADPHSRFKLADTDDDETDAPDDAELDSKDPDAPPTTPQPTKPPAPAVGGAPPTTEPAQDTALNGAQVTAALEIVGQVARRELPRETGVSMLQAFFNLTSTRAEAIMGAVGRTFFAEQPAPAPALGGFGPRPPAGDPEPAPPPPKPDKV